MSWLFIYLFSLSSNWIWKSIFERTRATYACQMSKFAIECLHFSMIMFDFHLKGKKNKKFETILTNKRNCLLLLQLILDLLLRLCTVYPLELFVQVDRYLLNHEEDHHFSDVLQIVYWINHVSDRLIREVVVLRHDWFHVGIRSRWNKQFSRPCSIQQVLLGHFDEK